MDNMIRLFTGAVFLSFFAIGIAVAIFYILTLSRALNKCHPASRTMEPGMVWLLLIPLFNLIWNFFVVQAMTKSLANEFRLRNIPNADPEPGKTIGLAMAICGACSIIPLVNMITGLVYIVLWIIYWIKIAGFSQILDQVPASAGPAPIQAL
ncbi:hypothetical protein [Occallatibacter savannae]|uniref:hypothetical protein n=1 Tax=Occallatibacter savannae TaxID=1002691 RepID=UPI000D68ED4D|nr:hypothetical protein [Occallatibacter savannae]